MRLGILTLHDSTNYGALLQARALRSHLVSLGHEAVVVDRRRNADLSLRVPEMESAEFRLFGLLAADAHDGVRENLCRIRRTEEFLAHDVGLSSARFHDWREAPAELGVDAIVVGSDQVWNANNLDPRDYLPGRLPAGVPALAYAASVGMPELPAELAETFRRSLGGFAAVGVREASSVDMLRALGAQASHVVDPVLLAGREPWLGVLDGPSSGGGVFAYFLAEDLEANAWPLAEFARSRGQRVEFFVDWYCRRTPHGFGRWRKNLRDERRLRSAGVDLRLDAGPLEFLRSLCAADVVVSNSYHALMFAMLFGKEIRIVLPSHPVRRLMNGRFREFEDIVSGGPLFSDSLRGALESLAAGERVTFSQERLASRVGASQAWLVRALEKVGARTDK